MASDKQVFSGLNTDAPPDRLGDQLFRVENLVPRSPSSLIVRPGTSFIGSTTGEVSNIKLGYSLIPGETAATATGLLISSTIASTVGGATVSVMDAVHLFRPRDLSWLTTPGSTITAIQNGMYNLSTSVGKPMAVQFADRLFLFVEDQRPIVLIREIETNTIGFAFCGILPPLTAPTVASSATAATNLTAGETVTVGYAYYSSSRNTFSRMSPTIDFTVANPAKKLTISVFEAPRDVTLVSPTENGNKGIDYIVICVQHSGNAGLMAHTDYTYLYISPTAGFTSATFTYDASAEIMELGFNFSEADPYFDVPPAVRYGDSYGERMWMGGQPKVVDSNVGTVTVARSQSFRGQTVTKLTVASGNGWANKHRHHSVYVKTTANYSVYLGELFDFTSTTVGYLDRDITSDLATLAASGTIMVFGYNDRIWPSSYHNFTMGSVPTIFPECVNLLDYQMISQVIDSAQIMKGIKRYRDELAIVFDDSAVAMSGGGEVGQPLPYFRREWGRTGCVAPRSICEDGEGNLAWIGEEGIVIGNTAGIRSAAHEIGCNRLFKGGQWIATSDLSNIVMTYSREYDGFIFGNFTINGTGSYWGLLTLQPQVGIWLFTGQRIDSNIIEVINSSGQGMLIAGDRNVPVSGDTTARLKRLLDPSVYTDIDATTATGSSPAAYTWTMRAPYDSDPSGELVSPAALRILGLIAPAGTITLSISHWRDNYPQRNESDIATADKLTYAATETSLLHDISLAPGAKRYHSLALSASSTSGLTSTRAAEVCRLLTIYAKDRRPQR